MKRASFCPLLVAAAAAFLIFLAFSATPAKAIDIIVPTDYPRIQDALDAAFGGDTVFVEPGTYREHLTMRDGVVLLGIETARTFLDGSGAGTVITVSGDVTGAISNFTFINASVGILVADNAGSMEITNNVFEVGPGNTAISVQNAAATTILNNTFYNNGTAINRDADIPVNSNIFANSQIAAITDSSALDTLTAYNDFFSNVATGPTGTNSVNADPLFVDAVNHDFHLRENSPCIDTGDPTLFDFIDGTTDDIGAYGGQFADLFPFPVAGLAAVAAPPTSIDLTWLPNLSYLVTNATATPGSYNVYYGYAPGDRSGNDPDTGQSPLSAGNNTTFTLASLNTASRIPPAPVLDQVVPGNSQLVLSWTAVPHATGYKVHYGQNSTGENTPLDVGNVTTYRLTGLTNGQSYVVAISTYAPATYYISVTALDNTVDQHESDFSSEVVAQIGPSLDSELSGVLTGSPDVTAGYPLLKGTKNGCFIATAAYGSYSAPEVLALRSFRDRYLLTMAPGRLFVRTYYHYSPAAAALLNAHPVFKPLVRAALMPAVGAAMFLTETSPLAKTAGLLLAGCGLLLVLVSKRRRQVQR